MWKPAINLATGNAQAPFDTLGRKFFELTNHLGNVLATITDRRVQAGADTVLDHYDADIATEQDYYAFGMQQPGRTYSANGGNYRYGFNGQEKSTEIDPNGNLNTAEHWEYDTRLGKRWNLDPKSPVELSGYSVMGNNPILNDDPNGLDWIHLGDKYIWAQGVHSTAAAIKQYGKGAVDVTAKGNWVYLGSNDRQVILYGGKNKKWDYTINEMKQDPTGGQKTTQEFNEEWHHNMQMWDPALAATQAFGYVVANFSAGGLASMAGGAGGIIDLGQTWKIYATKAAISLTYQYTASGENRFRAFSLTGTAADTFLGTGTVATVNAFVNYQPFLDNGDTFTLVGYNKSPLRALFDGAAGYVSAKFGEKLFDARWAKGISPRMVQTFGTSMTAVPVAVASDAIKDKENKQK